MWTGPGTVVCEAIVQGARPLHADQRANHRGGTTRRRQAARSRVVGGRYGARRHPAPGTVHTTQCHAAEFSAVRRQLGDVDDVGQSVAKMCRQSTSATIYLNYGCTLQRLNLKLRPYGALLINLSFLLLENTKGVSEIRYKIEN